MHETIAPVGAEGAVASGGESASDAITLNSTGFAGQTDVAKLRRIAVHSAAYIFAARLVLQLFNWVVTVITARILFPHDYGILAAAGIFTILADILAEAGMCRALVQKTHLSDDDVAGAFTFSLISSLAMYAVVVGCAGLGAKALQTPELATVLPVLGLALLSVPFRSVPMAILEHRLQLKRSATVSLACSFAQGCVVLGLAVAGFGYWALIAGSMVANFLAVPVLAWQASWLPRLRWPGGWSNPLVSYGVHFTGGALCWYAYRNVDYAIVGRVLGPVALGYYSLAFTLISMPVDKIVATCNRVSFPVFCRLRHDRERVRDWYLRLAVLFGFVATPVLVGLAVVAQDAVLLVLGEKWLPAVRPMQAMSVAGVVMMLGSSIDVLFNAMGRPDVNFKFTAFSLLVYPPLFYVCGLYWGVIGVAMVWAIFYPIMVLLLIGMTRSITGIGVRDVVSSQFPLWTSALFMALVVVAVEYSSQGVRAVAARLAISVAAGVLSYAAAIRVLAWESVMGNLRLAWSELRGRK
jgi:teichuronic acid exporter